MLELTEAATQHARIKYVGSGRRGVARMEYRETPLKERTVVLPQRRRAAGRPRRMIKSGDVSAVIAVADAAVVVVAVEKPK